MNSMKAGASCCGRCNYYTPEGRRGGHCDQLNVMVKSRWRACPLAVPVFLTPLPQLESVDILSKPIEIHLPETMGEVVLLEHKPPFIEQKKALAIGH